MLTVRGIFIPLAVLVVTPAIAQADTPTPGDIPDNQAFVRFTTASYSLVAPEGWARTTNGPRVTLTDKYNSIRVEIGAAAKAPTVRSVTSVELPRLRSGIPGFRSPTVTSLVRRAGRVVLVRYQARSRRDAVTGRTVLNDVERYEFWKSGRVAVLTLQAPHGSDNVDPWRTVTDSFRWR
ncbi:MAG: hypothetical protein M3Q31_18845 [Actinomycetota bacterium]|nr:hypothetical protein [Actinomycetota bacterium]